MDPNVADRARLFNAVCEAVDRHGWWAVLWEVTQALRTKRDAMHTVPPKEESPCPPK